LIVGGAAMTVTNTAPSEGIDPRSGGLVCMGVGLIWLVVSVALWDFGRDDRDDELAGQRIIYTGGARRPPRPSERR
jgi:hypothetical protein